MIAQVQEIKKVLNSNPVFFVFLAAIGAIALIGFIPHRILVESKPMRTFQSTEDLKAYLKKTSQFGVLNGSDDKSVTQIYSLSLKLCRFREICVLSNTIPSGLVWCFKEPTLESGADAVPFRPGGDCATVPIIARVGEVNYLTGKYGETGDDFDSIPLEGEESLKPNL